MGDIMSENTPVIIVYGPCQGGEILGKTMFVSEDEISRNLKNRDILSEIARSITGEDNVEIIVFKEEFGTSSGSIDILAIDNKGRIYLFELKRGYKSDSEWDRKALAQLLEYAAAIYEDYSQNVESFIERLDAEFSEDIIKEIKSNLETGEYFLIIVAPSIPERLKRALSYLVTISEGKLKLYEVTVRKFGKGDCQVLELLATSKPLTPKSSEERVWTEKEVIDFINSLQDEKMRERLSELVNVIKEANVDDIGGRTKNLLIRVRIKKKDKSRIILTFDASNGNIFAYIGIQGEKDTEIIELKKQVYEKLVELDLIEPDIDIKGVSAGRNLKKTICELSTEQFEGLLNIIKELISIY